MAARRSIKSSAGAVRTLAACNETPRNALIAHVKQRGATVMPRDHPHRGASYRILPRDGNAYGVEVMIPEMAPTTVSGFPTLADAERWIARHKEIVAAGRPVRSTFRTLQRRS